MATEAALEAYPSDDFFHGVRAHFVEAGIQPRRLKIWSQRIRQFGGTVEDHFSHEITHIFASNVEKLQEKVSLRKLKHFQVKALRYEWIQDCLKEGRILPSEYYELQLESKRRASTVSGEVQDESDAVVNEVGTGPVIIKQAEKDKDESGNDAENSRLSDHEKQEHEEKTASDQNNTSGGASSSIEFGSEDSGMEVLSLATPVSNGEQGSPSLSYMPPNLNQNITDPFTELRDIYKNALGDDRRSFSYHKAISVLEKLPFKIESFDQVKGLPTIGKSMLDNIQELLATGKLSKLEQFKNDERVHTLSIFSSIWGIGPVTAQKLYEKGYRSLDDLKDEPSLTSSQRVGLQFFDDLNVKIPRHEVAIMEALVKQVAEDIQPGMVIVCGGSYRRGKSYCGDMDFVFTHPNGKSHKGFLSKLVAALKDKGFLMEDLLVSSANSVLGTDSRVDTHYGLCKYPGRELRHRIDFKVYPIEMYPFGLIAWTGNDVLNRRLRLMAESKGFRLDDTGLFPIRHDAHGQKAKKGVASVSCKSEREVFEILGFPWLKPHERNL